MQREAQSELRRAGEIREVCEFKNVRDLEDELQR